VKKIIDSSVRSERKGSIKVATAKGERANRFVRNKLKFYKSIDK
jgi:hypothetical protein